MWNQFWMWLDLWPNYIQVIILFLIGYGIYIVVAGLIEFFKKD